MALITAILPRPLPPTHHYVFKLQPQLLLGPLLEHQAVQTIQLAQLLLHHPRPYLLLSLPILLHLQ